MNPSFQISEDSSLRYLLSIADLCLIHAQRLGEWSGHAPVLEEDIGLTNIALDLIGQTRALYSHVAKLERAGHDEDQLAFLRDERDYFNPTMVELPKGDFAHTCLRNLAVSTLLSLLWDGLQKSNDPEVEATPEDSAARASGLGPAWGEVEGPWRTELHEVLKEARLSAPPAVAFRSYGRRGRHSEHMGYLLAEMQYLQRAFPEGAW